MSARGEVRSSTAVIPSARHMKLVAPAVTALLLQCVASLYSNSSGTLCLSGNTSTRLHISTIFQLRFTRLSGGISCRPGGQVAPFGCAAGLAPAFGALDLPALPLLALELRSSAGAIVLPSSAVRGFVPISSSLYSLRSYTDTSLDTLVWDLITPMNLTGTEHLLGISANFTGRVCLHVEQRHEHQSNARSPGLELQTQQIKWLPVTQSQCSRSVSPPHCVFPFTYLGVTYTTCTDIGLDGDGLSTECWCATATDQQGAFVPQSGDWTSCKLGINKWTYSDSCTGVLCDNAGRATADRTAC